MRNMTENEDVSADAVISLNVGGTHFQVLRSTLVSKPNTRLARLVNPSQDDGEEIIIDGFTFLGGVYFFDRDPKIFERILSFYRNGEMHLPHDSYGPDANAELKFWGVSVDALSKCCKESLRSSEIEQERKYKMLKKFSLRKLACDPPGERASRWKRFQYRAYVGLERPLSSLFAGVYTFMTFLVIMADLIIAILSTSQDFRTGSVQPTPPTEPRTTEEPKKPKEEEEEKEEDADRLLIGIPKPPPPPTEEPVTVSSAIDDGMMIAATKPLDIFLYITIACFVYLALDLLIRFVIYPRKRAFFKNPVNVIDFVCLIMHAANEAINLYAKFYQEEAAAFMEDIMPLLLFLGCANVLRLCRIIGFASQLPIVRVLLLTLLESWKILLLMAGVMGMGTLIFGPLIYIADYYNEGTFKDMSIGCWWAIVTMTTVGYGDQYPGSFFGYVIGSICALTGLVLTALPIAVVGNNFTTLYSFLQENYEELERMNRIERKGGSFSNPTETVSDLDAMTKSEYFVNNHHNRGEYAL